MKKIAVLIFALLVPHFARAQTAQLFYAFTATVTGGVADTSLAPQVDALNVRISGISTTASWTAQIQTSPDNSTWTSCGSLVTATSGASSSGGGCTPSGAAYTRVLITAGSGGGSVVGALIGTCSLCQVASSGGITLTTTGTSGAATLVGSTLNIPVYAGAAPGGATDTIQLNAGSGAFGASSATDNGTTFSIGEPVSAPGYSTSGAIRGYFDLVQNATAAPTQPANSFRFLAPTSGLTTSYNAVVPLAAPTAANSVWVWPNGGGQLTFDVPVFLDLTQTITGAKTFAAATNTFENASGATQLNMQTVGNDLFAWYLFSSGGSENNLNLYGGTSAGTLIFAASGHTSTPFFGVAPAGVLGFASTSPATTLDTGFSRVSSGVVDLGTGAALSVAGTLKLATLTAGTSVTTPSFTLNSGTALTSQSTANSQIVTVAPGTRATGLGTLVLGTVTISNAAACTASATCTYKLTNCGTNSSVALGTLTIGTVVPGTSFIINSESAANAVVTTDVSSVCWQVN